MRTSVGPETEATTLRGPKEKDALASALASVPSWADRGRSAVGDVRLGAEQPCLVDIDEDILSATWPCACKNWSLVEVNQSE